MLDAGCEETGCETTGSDNRFRLRSRPPYSRPETTPMEKLAIGCGVVLVVLVIGGAIAAWYAYRKASGMYAD